MRKCEQLNIIKEDFELTEMELCRRTGCSRSAIRSYLAGNTEPNDGIWNEMVKNILESGPAKVGPFTKRYESILENEQFRRESKEKGSFDHSNVVCNYVKDIRKFIEQIVPENLIKDFRVKESLGDGRLADVYWIAIMEPKGCPQLSTMFGRYICLLFSSTFETISLCIMAGTQQYNNRLSLIESSLFADREYINSFLLSNPLYRDLGFSVGDANLRANTARAKAYEKAVIVSKTLSHFEITKEDLVRALLDIVNLYDIYMKRCYIPEILESELNIEINEQVNLTSEECLGVDGTRTNEFWSEVVERPGIDTEEYKRLRALLEENKKMIGDYSEYFAYNEENRNKKDDEEVEWTSKTKDGKGYDLRITNEAGKVLALKEIKGTTKPEKDGSLTVYITRNELTFAKTNSKIHYFSLYNSVYKDPATNEIHATKFGEFRLFDKVTNITLNSEKLIVRIVHDDYDVELYLASSEAKFIKKNKKT